MKLGRIWSSESYRSGVWLVMNVTSIFDEYGHHENKSERINRIISGIL